MRRRRAGILSFKGEILQHPGHGRGDRPRAEYRGSHSWSHHLYSVSRLFEFDVRVIALDGQRCTTHNKCLLHLTLRLTHLQWLVRDGSPSRMTACSML